jgi:hypothetical protein
MSSLRTLAVLALVLAAPARADWVSLSGAENAANTLELHVEEDRVRAVLELLPAQVVELERLIPDELLEGAERPPLEERLRAFAEEDLRVEADDVVLVPELVTVEPRLRKPRSSPWAGKPNPVTGQLVPGPPEDERVLFVELVYALEGAPRTLSFAPPLDTDGSVRMPIGFVTTHREVQLHPFRYLSQEVVLHLDHGDPWYSEYEHPNLKRWQRGAVMSFLYVEDLEVRHEVLARLRDLEPWLDLGLADPAWVEAEENGPLKQRIGAFFLEREDVTIDGERVEPFLDRVTLVKTAETGSTFLAAPERLRVDTTMVGVIVTYPVDALPGEVRSRWSLWSDRVQLVPTVATDPAGPLASEVTPGDDVEVWRNHLVNYEPPTVAAIALDDSITRMSVPLASAACLLGLVLLGGTALRRRRRGEPWGPFLVPAATLVLAAGLLRPLFHVEVPRPSVLAAAPADEEARDLLERLLANTYRSFDLRREEDVYDRLAASVAGDLLSDVYLESRRSLAVEQAGGAQARVERVEVLDAEVEPHGGGGLGLRYRARWSALGSVGHWGHVHTRMNLYDADVTVEEQGGVWKITGLDVRDEQRVGPGMDAPVRSAGG